MTTFIEAGVEQAALEWLASLGWQMAHQRDIGPETANAERDDYGQVVLEESLRDILPQLNPGLPASALDDVFSKLTRPEGSILEARKRAFHRMLVNGVEGSVLFQGMACGTTGTPSSKSKRNRWG